MLSVLRADPASFRAFVKTGANGARLHPAYPRWYLETMGVDLSARLLKGTRPVWSKSEIEQYYTVDTNEETNLYRTAP